jgi:hypothetical protein
MKNYNIVKVERNKIIYKNGESINISRKDYSYLIQELEKDIINYRNMIDENTLLNEEISDEINRLLVSNTEKENYIKANQHDPYIRRGFADICYRLEADEKKIHDLCCESRGVRRVIDRDVARLERLEKALKTLLNYVINEGFQYDFASIERH